MSERANCDEWCVVRRAGVRRALCFGFLFVPLFLPLAARAQDPGAVDPGTRSAVEFIRAMDRGDFAGAAAAVAPPLAAGVMSAGELEGIWGQLRAQLGPLDRLTPLRAREQGGYRLVELAARFGMQELVLLVPLDGEGRVAGFRLLPAAAASYTPPSYADTTAFSEREVEFGETPFVLGGTVTLPAGAGPFPAVVLVHGSGPNDRDESIGPNRPFRDLAWGLATEGIAVLRYDKRTRTHGHLLDPATLTVEEEVLDDVAAALDLLRAQPGVDARRVFIVGHSLGATLAPVAAERDGRVAGAVLLAGMARPLGETLQDQVRYLAPLQVRTEDDRARVRELLDELAALVDGTLPDTASVMGMPARYIRALDALRPVEAAAAGRTPLLVLQGERDYQVTMTDFGIWRSALAHRGDVALRSYPDLDHLLMAGEGPSRPEDYLAGERKVAGEVVRDVAEWIRTLRLP
jgi:uncharacterized protein